MYLEPWGSRNGPGVVEVILAAKREGQEESIISVLQVQANTWHANRQYPQEKISTAVFKGMQIKGEMLYHLQLIGLAQWKRMTHPLLKKTQGKKHQEPRQ